MGSYGFDSWNKKMSKKEKISWHCPLKQNVSAVSYLGCTSEQNKGFAQDSHRLTTWLGTGIEFYCIPVHL